VLFLGDLDVGKSRSIFKLAGDLAREGRRVAVVDADIGQSDIGPPTTVGLGAVEGFEGGMPAVAPEELYFVGSTSPRGHMLPLVVGTRKLVDRARLQDYASILVDTTGFVRGRPGRILKQNKIELVEPDLLVCLQKKDECDQLLMPYDRPGLPRLMRLRPDPGWAVKSPEERRANRWKAFMDYFHEASTEQIQLTDLPIENAPLLKGRSLSRHEQETVEDLLKEPLLWGERIAGELLVVVPRSLDSFERYQLEQALGIRRVQSLSESQLRDVIVGLNDAERRTLGVGIVRSIDFAQRAMFLTTPVAIEKIHSILLSTFHWREEEL
jgi:polynucleotide 5'-hydroxyl-kinase GRC3/NOL9